MVTNGYDMGAAAVDACTIKSNYATAATDAYTIKSNYATA